MACDHPAISGLTPQDFKDQFTRGFDYLPTWLIATTYNTGAVVYYDVNDLFYICKVNGTVGVVPTDTNNWDLTEDNKYDYVNDQDITNAYAEACITYNSSLLSTDNDIKLAYLYLTAHYLVNDFRSGGQTDNGRQNVTSRSAGSISESYAIPSWMLDSPQYSFYTTSNYGLKYLNLLLPYLRGNVMCTPGATNA